MKRPGTNRRQFIALSTATAAAAFVPAAMAQPAEAVPLELPRTEGILMPDDFAGLSYEAGQLYNPDFFSPANTALIAAFRNLSAGGVLRLGGHLSNITPWEGVGLDDPKQIRGVRHGIEDYWEWPLVDPSIQKNKHGIITRHAIQNLRAFLDAVGWRLIYCLNFASGSPARAADEAAFVSKTMGTRLLAFVLGNEVDGYGDDPVFRAKGYNFDQYFAEYRLWTRTIRAAVPKAPFAGPDTEHGIDDWVQPFARSTRGDAVLLTSHLYGMGPASDPSMTAEKLLRKSNPELDHLIDGAHTATRAAGGTPFRMDEGNSCFGGGRPGVSDAYASALWAADFMLRLASAGIVGVNLHGGGTGIYTPIETSSQFPAAPRPVYFGMQFALHFSGYKVAPCAVHGDVNLTAYVGSRGARTQLAVINKSSQPILVKFPAAVDAPRLTHTFVLSGPTLDAKQATTLTPHLNLERNSTRAIPGYTAVLFTKA